MPQSDSPAAAVLQSLGFALLLREPSGAFRRASGAPDWLTRLWPTVGDEAGRLDPSVSPFLENFLIDAEEFWKSGSAARITSGPWIEQDSTGESVQLEATALSVDGQSVLLLERLGEAFETRKSMLQKARENVIAYQRLNSEIQKKEILLHCVAEDMTAALANIITSLRLLELENSSPRGRQLLGLATRATEEQQALIHKVLAVFADELSGLFGPDGGSERHARIGPAMANAVEALRPQLEEKRIRLTTPATASAEANVALDPAHLQRVITNLLENALEQSKAAGEIVLAVEEEADAVVIRVEDDGPSVESDACESLFSKLEPAAAFADPRRVRLHFCRMMAESCGGEIGCRSRGASGNCFWIRVPKIFANE
jgi:signal transduction histidine kinase